MKKRILSLALVLCMLMAVSGPVASAAEAQPYYVAIGSMHANISDPVNGRIPCYGSVFVRRGYKADLTLELMQKQNGSWDSIKSWETSGSGAGTIELSKSYYVVSGYEYKVLVSVDIYTTSGTYVESETLESGSLYY